VKLHKLPITLAATALLSACGGGSSAPSSGGGFTGGTPTPSPSATSSACSLSSQQTFARDVINDWYLFPDLVDTSVTPANYSTVQDYIDALVRPARDAYRDRYFTYVTSIAEENAYYQSGSTAGFGIRLSYDPSTNRAFVLEAFEGAPGLAAGLDRGTEILAIGTSAGTLQNVSDILAAGGAQALSDALGPSDPGVTRVLRIRQLDDSVSTVTVTKQDFELDPVSDRYGAKVIDNNGTKVGYVNLRTFIDTADPDLRSAFQSFRDQGVTQIIVDLRYNGGGLVSVAELLGDLMGKNNVGQVFSRTTTRPDKQAEYDAAYDPIALFKNQPQSIAPARIAFIGTGGTASASELVMNSMLPYLSTNMALVGSNTYGKPVGQFAFDNDECDQRMRVIAFRTENADGQGDYYTGLAGTIPNSCQAKDDMSYQLGDPREASIAGALNFLTVGSCAGISAAPTARSAPLGRALLTPREPTAAQHETPGLF